MERCWTAFENDRNVEVPVSGVGGTTIDPDDLTGNKTTEFRGR